MSKHTRIKEALSNKEALSICDIAKKTFLDSKDIFNVLEGGEHALEFKKTRNDTDTQTLYSLAE